MQREKFMARGRKTISESIYLFSRIMPCYANETSPETVGPSVVVGRMLIEPDEWHGNVNLV